MKYLPNSSTICLEASEYIGAIVPENTYKSQQQRKTIAIHGRGCKGNGVLIEYESLPAKYKEMVVATYGDPYEYIARQPLLRLVRPDVAARNFYASHQLQDGRVLPVEYQQRYTRQAEWFNMINIVLEDKRALKQELHITLEQFWQSVIALHQNDKPINPQLPGSERRITERVRKYKAEGYKGLVEAARFNNSNARKVTGDIEGLLLSLYLQRHGRATLVQVANDFKAFMAGKDAPVDLVTGEAFDPKDFLIKGEMKPLALATVRHYLNKKGNREVVDSFKLGGHDFVQKHAPHNRRKGPQFSFSMVSMDDYLPPFKTPDGKRTVWMYVIFDVASTAIVGVSYGTKKGVELVNEALRDMLRLCFKNGWGLPMEIEVERSLNWARKGSEEMPDLFTEGNVFPFVRFAKANNSQEKIAERFLGSFKYEELADDAGFLGRPFGRNENYKLNKDNAETRYAAEVLINRLRVMVQRYNNVACPKDDRFTRNEYLEQHINPEAINNQPAIIMPYIGRHTKSSIHRGDVQVQNEYYKAPAAAQVNASGGRADMDAYWIPGEQGEAPEEIYLYQDGKYVGVAPLIERYQNARAERTERDYELLGKQSGRQVAFAKTVEENGQKLRLVATTKLAENEGEQVKVSYDKEREEEEEYDAAMGLEGVQNVPESAPKTGGYLQKNDSSDEDFVDLKTIKSRALSAL